MPFEISSKKKANNQKLGNGSGLNSISSASIMTNKSQTNRAGLRVFKIVILGDGGVGKSGKRFFVILYLQQIVCYLLYWRKWHPRTLSLIVLDDAKYFYHPRMTLSSFLFAYHVLCSIKWVLPWKSVVCAYRFLLMNFPYV